MHAAAAYLYFVLGLLLADQSLKSYFLGINRGLFWDEVYREESPRYFWTSWSLWGFAAAFLLVGASYRCFLAIAEASSGIVDQLAAMTILQMIVYLGFPTLLLVVLAWKWIKGGNPVRFLRYLRENGELRKELGSLVAESDTGMDGVSMKEFMEHAGNEWLQDIARYLRQQPMHQRSLKTAISATSDPEEDSFSGRGGNSS